MINKKLLSFDRKALRYVGLNVLFQWLGMLALSYKHHSRK